MKYRAKVLRRSGIVGQRAPQDLPRKLAGNPDSPQAVIFFDVD